MMSMSMFKEIFTELIDYLVERIQSNYALQIIPNSFLANSTTSPTFASILLNFLLKVLCQRRASLSPSLPPSLSLCL